MSCVHTSKCGQVSGHAQHHEQHHSAQWEQNRFLKAAREVMAAKQEKLAAARAGPEHSVHAHLGHLGMNRSLGEVRYKCQSKDPVVVIAEDIY